MVRGKFWRMCEIRREWCGNEKLLGDETILVCKMGTNRNCDLNGAKIERRWGGVVTEWCGESK